jgi:hypothetical protein
VTVRQRRQRLASKNEWYTDEATPLARDHVIVAAGGYYSSVEGRWRR